MKHFLQNASFLLALILGILILGSLGLGLKAQGKYFSRLGGSLDAAYDKFSPYKGFEVFFSEKEVLTVAYEALRVEMFGQKDEIRKVHIRRDFNSRKESHEFRDLFEEVMGYLNAVTIQKERHDQTFLHILLFKDRRYSCSWKKLGRKNYRVELEAELLPKGVDQDFVAYYARM